MFPEDPIGDDRYDPEEDSGTTDEIAIRVTTSVMHCLIAIFFSQNSVFRNKVFSNWLKKIDGYDPVSRTGGIWYIVTTILRAEADLALRSTNLHLFARNRSAGFKTLCSGPNSSSSSSGSANNDAAKEEDFRRDPLAISIETTDSSLDLRDLLGHISPYFQSERTIVVPFSTTRFNYRFNDVIGKILEESKYSICSSFIRYFLQTNTFTYLDGDSEKESYGQRIGVVRNLLVRLCAAGQYSIPDSFFREIYNVTNRHSNLLSSTGIPTTTDTDDGKNIHSSPIGPLSSSSGTEEIGDPWRDRVTAALGKPVNCILLIHHNDALRNSSKEP